MGRRSRERRERVQQGLEPPITNSGLKHVGQPVVDEFGRLVQKLKSGKIGHVIIDRDPKVKSGQ